MITLLLFVLAAIGLTDIMVESSIMAPFRNWLKPKLPEKVYEVFECHQCMGFWCGLICALLIIWNCNISFVLLCGFAGSFCANLLFIFKEFLVSKTELSWNNQDSTPTQSPDQ